MNRKSVYLILFILGILLPYLAFLPWLSENGLDLGLLASQIAAAPLAAFAWLDVLVSAIALFVFIYVDGRRLAVRKQAVRWHWLAVAGTLLVGVSLGLPLYLLLRELSGTA